MTVYNSEQAPLRMPEYGRHVQDMVKYCIGLEDRAERNQCAQQIVQTMALLSPNHESERGEYQVYWDHLAIIADFNLDIDYPEGTITQEAIESKPDPIPYGKKSEKIQFRYYGRIVEGMIKEACAMPQGPERAALEYFIAVQMKRNYMTWNNTTVEDTRIFADLFMLSDEQIVLTPENCKIVINPNSIDRAGKQKVPKKMLKQK